MRISFQMRMNALTFLIWLNVIMFVLPMGLSLLVGGQVSDAYGLFLYLFGGLRADWVILDGQPWRLLAANYLHVDPLHIFANMFALWQLGRIVQVYYGGKQLFSFYTICGLAGSFASLLLLGGNSTVGASGAVFGLMGVLVGSTLRTKPGSVSLPFGLADVLPLVLYAFIVGLIPGFAVNNWAHLGGFTAGVILGFVFDHKLTVASSRWMIQTEKILFALSVAVTVITFGFVALNLVTAILG